MEKPDAVIVDLDGTLLNAQRHCSRRNHQALERCMHQGIRVSLFRNDAELNKNQ